MTENVGSAEGYWINLNDIDKEGNYMWQSSLTVLSPDQFEAWGTNQPDGVPEKNCVAAATADNFSW